MKDRAYHLTGLARVIQDLQAQIRETFEDSDLEGVRATLQRLDLDRVDGPLAPFFEKLKRDADLALPLLQACQERAGGLRALVRQMAERLQPISESLDLIHASSSTSAITQLAARMARGLSMYPNIRRTLMEVGELAPLSSTTLFSVLTPFAETIRSTCFVSDLRRDQMLFPQNIMPIFSNVTSFLNQFSEQSLRISTSITQLFERIHTDHLGLRQVGEHLHLLSLDYDNALALPSFSTDLGQFIQATLPDYTVKPARPPTLEARRRYRLHPPEWPAIPAELQAKSPSEIAQEAEIYCLNLFEEDEQSAWEILDEHERRYTDEIERAEWDLIEAQEAGCAETASQIIQVKRIYSIKRKALHCSRRSYLV